INITSNPSQDIFPMWYKDEIYFLSDRDRIMNLFAYNIQTKETRKITDYTDYDIKFPSIGNNKIIFEKGGYIYVFNIDNQKTEKISIEISDDLISGRNELKDASKNINYAHISPDGNRIVFSARGDIFSVPVKSGITLNLTQSAAAHDRNAVWSPDGKYIAWISDMNGENEIYIQKPDCIEKPVQLTKNSDTYMYRLKWSPDSKKIMWSDRKLRLQYIDIETKNTTLVIQSANQEIRVYNWSPDSKWLTYSYNEKKNFQKVMIYNLEKNKNHEVTQDWFSSTQPVFSSDGKYLCFVSERDFNPTYSDIEWNYSYKEMSRIYLVILSKTTKSPFSPENAEVDMSKPEESKKDKTETPAFSDMIVDIDGIQDRVISIPVKAANYRNISIVDENVYYLRNAENEKTALYIYNLKDQKETKAGDFDSYKISANNKKMMIIKDSKYYIVDIPKAEVKIEKNVGLENMKVMTDLKKEWTQIYNESWRQMRDFFYDPNMHGVNWGAVKDKYSVMLPFVNNRNDLNYLIGEMIGELSCGHAYVSGGDKPAPKRISMGLLGAKISKHESGYFKIDKILEGENWNKSLRSPLTELGVDVNIGDYIIMINGKSVKDVDDLYSLLVNMADKQVEFYFNSKPVPEGAKKSIVIPIADESPLYYYNWVQNNIKKVNDATKGQVGYIHIPDMGVDGLNEFVKYFYPQLNRKALIIDDRGNGGGNVSPMIIERLRRELSLMSASRNSSEGNPKPSQMHYGPKVLLMNNYSASDGDLFPYQFKKHNLGKTIGVRSWGGVVGIRGSLPFIDGGQLQKPEFAHYDSEGKEFIIEGYGVDPDIVIDNDPAKEYEGIDEQLNKAVKIALEELEKWNKSYPEIPPFPDKSK
ncbi:MAG: S41 family peptidase, partial [Bacteroidota bacterium]